MSASPVASSFESRKYGLESTAGLLYYITVLEQIYGLKQWKCL